MGFRHPEARNEVEDGVLDRFGPDDPSKVAGFVMPHRIDAARELAWRGVLETWNSASERGTLLARRTRFALRGGPQGPRVA
ncbi:MAG TPA: hypothetical protein VFC47_11305 [Caulobacteraceae bacterium]|nr:hypothetical protein [Caulobacteraceae bacterium]